MDHDGAAATLKDVAHRAGVSSATASLALRGKGRMSQATRDRVRDAAVELNYVVNVVARNLRTARSGSTGLYIPDHTLSYRYYMDVAFGVVERAAESELLVTLMPTEFASQSAIADQLDGFILMDPEDGDPVVERLLSGRQPVVSGEGIPAGLPAAAGVVRGDHDAGIRLLLDHLWERGARRILCVLPGRTVAWGVGMYDGFMRWSEERGAEPLLVEMDGFRSDAEELKARVDARLAADPSIDAVLAAPEGAAVMAMHAIRGAGRRVGEDVLLASYVDSDPLALVVPSITALDLRPREFGRACMDLLIRSIEDPTAPPLTIDVPITLIARDSTR